MGEKCSLFISLLPFSLSLADKNVPQTSYVKVRIRKRHKSAPGDERQKEKEMKKLFFPFPLSLFSPSVILSGGVTSDRHVIDAIDSVESVGKKANSALIQRVGWVQEEEKLFTGCPRKR